MTRPAMTNASILLRSAAVKVLIGLLLLPLLLVVHGYNPTLSHEAAEIFSVVVACGVFMVSWNSRRFIDNHYYLYIGIAYLFVGAVDFIHATAFKGLFGGHGKNLAAQLWYAGRYIQGFSLLIAPCFATRKLDVRAAISGYVIVTLLFMGAIFAWGIFPDALREGQGVTPFKVWSDYVVSVVLLAAMAHLYRRRASFDPEVFRLLLASIGASVASELAFNLYVDYYAYNNLVGHYLKIVSFFLVYRAIVATGLLKPYALLFRNLKESEGELRRAREDLEIRVAARTSELRELNVRLRQELAERARIVRKRGIMVDLLNLINASGSTRDLMDGLASFLADRFGCEAVGIRLRQGDDFPYVAAKGFPPGFVDAEARLIAADDGGCPVRGGEGKVLHACLCGAVIDGWFDMARPAGAEGASCCWNGADEIRGLIEEGGCPPRLRMRCLQEGYESIALVPLRLGTETLGLLQLNDRRRGRFTPEAVDHLERAADNIAIALARLMAEDALRESEDRFRSLVEHSPVGILIVQDGRVVFRNPELERLVGPVAEGAPFRTLAAVHPDDADRFARDCERMEAGEDRGHEADVRFLVGETEEVRWVQCRTIPVLHRGRAAILVNMVDISRLKDLEQTVVVREKMASLGHVAAGIAHEIRNPLSGINLNISTLAHLAAQLEGLDPGDKERIGALAAQAKAASDKISSVIQRVMDFAKPTPPRLDSVGINRVIEDALAFSSATLRRHGVELTKSLGADLPPCPADPRLLEQVFLNLIANAVQAMETTGGLKRLEIASCFEGGRVVVRVSDSGPGVPVHVRGKIFEPFFTTRRDGHGIGLSFSHRVVADHGGTLTVGPSRWGGAEFRIELPAGGAARLS